MKNITYKFLTIFLLSIILISCGNSNKQNTQKTDSGEFKNDHNEVEEVVLTQHQFDALQMEIDIISLRNMSGYVEANGTLEVPPQSEAAITFVVGANVVSIKVIEGDKVNKGQVVAYLSHPNIIKMQTDYLNAFSNSNFLKKNYKRQQKLYDAGVGSGANFKKLKQNMMPLKRW